MDRKLRVGVIGAGVFGTYHARKARLSPLAELIGIFDADGDRCHALADEISAPSCDDIDVLLDLCDAVIIATPARTHAGIAARALQSGKHVLVEKPLALSVADAKRLCDLAQTHAKVLQVGHQERFVCHTLGLLDPGVLPTEQPIERLEFVRRNPPPKNGRAMDVSVLWDLMIHDIDMAHALLGPRISDVSATGRYELGPLADEVQASFQIGHTHVTLEASRLAVAVDRSMRLVCVTGVIEIDLGQRTLANTTPFNLNEEAFAQMSDPLGAADEAFFAACLGLGPPMMTGQSAALAVATAKKLETLVSQSQGSSHHA